MSQRKNTPLFSLSFIRLILIFLERLFNSLSIFLFILTLFICSDTICGSQIAIIINSKTDYCSLP